MPTATPRPAGAPAPLPEPLVPGQPWTALAPMQNVTTLPFMRLLGRYGAPDLLFTEYFRVHPHSRPEAHIVDSIRRHGTGRPVFAQLIGESLDDLERTVTELHAARLPVAGIDLNMGCPAPKVYKKNVGGGLLRELCRADAVIGRLRACVEGRFTVKMRIGFEDDRHFEALLDLLETHRVDLLSLHGRTVRQGYRGAVHYGHIRRAADRLPCPVLANGNVSSVATGRAILTDTGAAGLMIGRACIRNPWIFRQLRETFAGAPVFRPTLADVRGYVRDLVETTAAPDLASRAHANYLKKFLNFVGLGVDPDGVFLREMRRAGSVEELERVCDRFLVDGGRGGMPFPDEPLGGLVARPNCETPADAGPERARK